MNKKATKLHNELEKYLEKNKPECTEKFTNLCKKISESGLADAEFLSEAFQTIFSKGESNGYKDGRREGVNCIRDNY